MAIRVARINTADAEQWYQRHLELGLREQLFWLMNTDRCHARLASLYGFPPLPPRPCLLPNEPEQKVEPSKQSRSKIMMAAQRIRASLCKEAPTRSSFAHLNQPSSDECKLPPVGPTALVVGTLRFIPLPSLAITLSLLMSSDPKHAYKGFVASSQRHGSVYSTLDAK